MEVEHHLFEFLFRHLPVGDADARFRHQLGEFAPGAFDALHFVVQEIHLPAARQFALEGFAQLRGIPLRDEGLHGQAMRGWRGNQRQVAKPGHRHVERARDWRGGEGEQMHLSAQGFERLFLPHAEALFLVDDDQTKILETHVFLQQPMRADDDVELTIGQTLQFGLDLFRSLETRQHFDAQRPVGEAITEIAEMLLGQQRSWHQHGDLSATHGGGERRAHGDFGLAESDITADHTIHRQAGLQIAQHGFDGAELIGGFFKRKAGGELLVLRSIQIDCESFSGLAAGLNFQ